MEKLKGYAYYLWMQEQKKNKYINYLYRRYKGLFDKESIILMYYNCLCSNVSINRAKKVVQDEFDKKYKKEHFKRGTCRLIHIGKKR